ncbi:MAG: hypothetical protein LUG94_04970, partial [Ruminococcus sp.]|nr:hypothetical protein [Ruminococcus sp.]
MNKKLLCTKFAHDYTYYLIEGDIKKNVDSSVLNPLETKLIRNDNLNLPTNYKINGTYGYYFDTITKDLKCGIWSYDTKKDDRGYLEVEFITLDVTDSLNVTSSFLSSLKSLLIITYTYFEKELHSIFSINIDHLFETTPKTQDLEIFLKLYFSFLPSNIASRIIVMHNYAEYSINVGKSVSCISDSPTIKSSFSNIYNYYLIDWLCCSVSTFEYKSLLYLSWIQLFNIDIKIDPYAKYTISVTDNNLLSLIDSSIQMTLTDKFNTTFKFYESFCSKKFDDKTFNMISNFISISIDTLLNKLYSMENFNSKLEIYKEILSKIKLFPQDSIIYSKLKDRLYFSKHTIDSKQELSYIQQCFKVLVTLGEDIIYEDSIYYSNQCFNYIKSSKTAIELNQVIDSIDHKRSISDFFNIVKPMYIQDDIVILYNSILQKSLMLLKDYYGYCDTADTKFIELNTEIEYIIELSKVVDKNPKQTFLNMYGIHCKDKILLQNLAMYFIDEDTISLTNLLELLKDFRVVDFYTKFNLVIFDALLSSLNRSSLPIEEKTQLSKLIQQYEQFRNQCDDIINLCMEQKYSKDDLNNDICIISSKNGEFIRTYLSTYNVCKSKESRQILTLINKNIVGNPILSAFIMYIYTDNIIGKTVLYKYTYYYQLYRLLFDFLIQDEELSINEVQYIQDISSKNSSIFHRETFTNKILYRLKVMLLNRTSFKNTIENISVPKILKKFVDTLQIKLSERYKLDSSQQKNILLKELQDYNNAYEYIFNNSIL